MRTVPDHQFLHADAPRRRIRLGASEHRLALKQGNGIMSAHLGRVIARPSLTTMGVLTPEVRGWRRGKGLTYGRWGGGGIGPERVRLTLAGLQTRT